MTVDDYLEALPEDRRKVVTAIRKLIRKNLPKGYEEGIGWNMLCYSIPLSRYPTTYNGQPLGYIALASQKNYCVLYLNSVYADPRQAAELKGAFAKAGKKMDMGKSCLRFKTAEDLPLDALAKLIAATPPEAMIALYEAAQESRNQKAEGRKQKAEGRRQKAKPETKNQRQESEIR
jgi:hypothetical protein